MSKYTTQVRFICESAAGLDESVGYNQVDSVINQAIPSVFDFDFPAYDSTHKTELEKMILLHYYTREIGFETVGLWKLNMKRKLNEIMPYYVKLMEAQEKLFEKDWLDFDTQYTREKEGGNKEDSSQSGSRTNNQTQDSSTTDTTTATNKNTRKYSQTPQGSLQNVENGTYLTEAEINDGKGDSTVTGSGNTTIEGTETSRNTDNKTGSFNETETVYGKVSSVPYVDLYERFTEVIKNINLQIVDELNDLFMGIW